LQQQAKKDSRMKITRLESNGHICRATNEAFKIASGTFIALLDHDDILVPEALSEIVHAIKNNPGTEFVYSDEDKLTIGGEKAEPFFKPDFSPHFLRSCNYITHFSCFKTSLFKKIGGFREGTEGAQDWDLILRATENTEKIVHIPRVLYSWRMSETSTASNSDSKPYAYRNQKKVLRDHVVRMGYSASVEESKYLGLWNVKAHIQDNPLVSIIIPNKNSTQLLKDCIDSIFDETTYSNFEVVVVDSGSDDQSTRELYKMYKQKYQLRFNQIEVKGTFNFSTSCNKGAQAASGDYFLFLNNDTKVRTADWIENMLGLAQQDDVGAVGAKLLYADKTIQHIGVHLSPEDVAHHTYLGLTELTHPYIHIYASNVRECSAVTAACLLVSAKKFKEVDGFDEILRVTYNDVDLCLKLLKNGYRNVYTPYAELYHFESKSVGKVGTSGRDMIEFNAAKDLMKSRWSDLLSHEAYFKDPLK
jgi:GT2 family glycosyltransferase